MVPAPSYNEIVTKTNRLAADWLLQVEERREKYLLQDFSFIGATACDGQPRSPGPGNPTQTRGLQLLDRRNAENWIITIEIVETMLSPKKRAFLQLRREAEKIKHSGERGRPGWVCWVGWRMMETGSEYSDITLKTWWTEIVDLAARIAIYRGCG
jgi:hypothetical protein